MGSEVFRKNKQILETAPNKITWKKGREELRNGCRQPKEE